MLLIVLFFMVDFSKKRKRMGFLVGFIVFFEWTFKIKLFFLVRSNYINLEDYYGD